MAKKQSKQDDAEQSKRFLETAKALKVDKSGKAFDAVLKIISPTKKAMTKKD